jgi:putative endonuclease
MTDKTLNRAVGDEGEEHAVKYLEKQGYRIVQRNYLRKWGELDIIAKRKGVLYFVEVKSVTSNFYISGPDWYRPEDNMHRLKAQRLKRAVQSYLAENGLSIETDWEFSLITVVMKRKSRELYKIEHLENLII